jgi:ribosomal protein L40E
MKGIGDIILTIAVLGGILVAAAVLTSLFTKAMYNRCAGCGALNAKRRDRCRLCGEDIPRS